MKTNRAVARYVKTLFEIAESRVQLESIFADIQLLNRVFIITPALSRLISNPRLNSQFWAGFMETNFKTSVSKLFMLFLVFLINKKRISLLPLIPPKFIELYYSHKNIRQVKIYSVVRLTKQQQTRLKVKIQTYLEGVTLEIKNIVKPDLIAGLQIHIGDTIIEANIKNRINRLKSSLAV